ncbi:hypothetical protein IV102_36105 [bacterium]|nr:hypothetical protein [bacterium]
MISPIQSGSIKAPRPSQGAPTPPPPPPDQYHPGAIEKGFTQVAGYVAGAAGSLISLAPSALTGAIKGVNHAAHNQALSAEDAKPAHATLTGLTLTAAGMAAGSGLGVAATIVGGVAGLIVGTGYAATQYLSGGSQRIVEPTFERVEKALADNLSSGSILKDSTKALVEGTLNGAAAGSRAAFGVGQEQGQGAAAGAIEGIKDGTKALLGQYDGQTEPPVNQQQEPPSIGRRVLRGAFGVAGASIGSTLSALDGALQGGVAGTDNDYKANKDFHRFTVKAQSSVSAAIAGGILLGPLGAIGGYLVGLGAGALLTRIENKTGIDQKIVDSVQTAVNQARANDPAMDNPAATFSRNLVEGAMVGAAAGVHSGAVYGYQGGVGAADASYDVAAGIASAIQDIVLGPKA